MPYLGPQSGAIAMDVWKAGREGYDYAKAKQAESQAYDLRERDQAIAEAREGRDADLYGEQKRGAILTNDGRELSNTLDRSLNPLRVEGAILGNTASRQGIDIKEELRAGNVEAQSLQNKGVIQTIAQRDAAEAQRERLRPVEVRQATLNADGTAVRNTGGRLSNALVSDQVAINAATRPERTEAAIIQAATKRNNAEELYQLGVSDLENVVQKIDTKQLNNLTENLLAVENNIEQQFTTDMKPEEIEQRRMEVFQKSEAAMFEMVERGDNDSIERGLDYMIRSPLYGVDEGAKMVYDKDKGIVSVYKADGELAYDEIQGKEAQYDVTDLQERKRARIEQSAKETGVQDAKDAASIQKAQAEAQLARAKAAATSSGDPAVADKVKGMTYAQMQTRQKTVQKEIENQARNVLGIVEGIAIEPRQQAIINRANELAASRPDYFTGQAPGMATKAIEEATRYVEFEEVAPVLSGLNITTTADEFAAAAAERGLTVVELAEKLKAVAK